VLRAALGTGAALTGAGVGSRALLCAAHARGWPLGDAASSLPLLSLSGADWTHVAAPVAVAAGVTAARQLLRYAWPQFREAGDAAGRATLRTLSPLDVTVVALASAAGEELLFRDALLPAVAADWRGALVAGIVFGALHVSGGRNAAYAAWASAVGLAYGLLALSLHDGWSPIAAHALANTAGGLLWRAEDDAANRSGL